MAGGANPLLCQDTQDGKVSTYLTKDNANNDKVKRVKGVTDTTDEEVRKDTSEPATSDYPGEIVVDLPADRIDSHIVEGDTDSDVNTARAASESKSSDVTISEDDWTI